MTAMASLANVEIWTSVISIRTLVTMKAKSAKILKHHILAFVMLVSNPKAINVLISTNVVISPTIVTRMLFVLTSPQIIAARVRKAMKVRFPKLPFDRFSKILRTLFVGDGFYCTIIDHCKSNPCPLTAVCSSSVAGPNCTCHEGYDTKTTLDKNGITVFEDCEKIPDPILKRNYTAEEERKKTYNG